MYVAPCRWRVVGKENMVGWHGRIWHMAWGNGCRPSGGMAGPQVREWRGGEETDEGGIRYPGVYGCDWQFVYSCCSAARSQRQGNGYFSFRHALLGAVFAVGLGYSGGIVS